jgi:CHAT domain-containing protein
LARIDRELSAIETRLSAEYPDLAGALATPAVPVAQVRRMLADDEALLFIHVGAATKPGLHLWLVRRDGLFHEAVPMTGVDLGMLVGRLRVSLGHPLTAPPFDIETAFNLYRLTVSPHADRLAGVSHLIVTPFGPLLGMPFPVLLERPPDHTPLHPVDFRGLAWLGRRLSISVLPTVQSIEHLRGTARTGASRLPFVGFGDPRSDKINPLANSGSAPSSEGGSVPARPWTARLPALPETADELRRMAEALGADPDSVHLGDKATETAVRKMPLADYRVVAFATHGLMASEAEGSTEPGLVLSPISMDGDGDGYLTASEVARLRLDADWVVLSACNTAASDGKPNAEGFSGLTRAFLYAGARSLLVSHWRVNSQAAVMLTTRMFGEIRDAPNLPRAEALRRSMMAMLDEAGPAFAHPHFWSPFALVGDGR